MGMTSSTKLDICLLNAKANICIDTIGIRVFYTALEVYK